MPTLLDIVRMELENADLNSMIGPTGEVGPGDHVVGEVDLEARKLFSLGMQWEKAANEAALAARYMSDKNKQKQAMMRAHQIHEKSDILLSIFWASLRDTFDLWDKSSVGIREGWKFVWSELDIPPILGILGELFGGGR